MLKKLLLVLSILAIVTPFLPFRVSAQEDPWGEVVDEDGNILYSNLTDLGEVHVDADWMPDVPFINGQATYHRYMTPSGNIVVMPSASTLFFMALNPDSSGINDAYGVLGNGIGVLETMLAGYITPEDLASLGYSDSESFWQSVINGETNIWTLEIMGDFLLDLLSSSLDDGNLYTMLLLYLNGDCDKVPGGCPAALPTPPPSSNACPSPYIETGPIRITGGSGNGGKIAPPHPVVIGQDPERRGVDIQVSVAIPPITYHFFEQITHHDQVCAEDPTGLGPGCADFPDDPNWKTITNTWYECVEHTQVFPDFLGSSRVSVNLTQASRSWIQNNLAQAYPGATLIHPDFTFSFFGPGTLLGDKSILWTMVIPNIQTADPGNYVTSVSVRTTGTIVSAPRTAQAGLGQFAVELVEEILIEKP